MNHYMMPFWNGQGLASPKYGNIALSTLLENMLYIGCQKKNLVAKVFGGSELLNSGVLHSFTGNRNIAIAFELLKDENIQVISHSIGGEKGRKIHFNTLTGQVRQKYL
jgi:chemotaxis protein CheD